MDDRTKMNGLKSNRKVIDIIVIKNGTGRSVELLLNFSCRNERLFDLWLISYGEQFPDGTIVGRKWTVQKTRRELK